MRESLSDACWALILAAGAGERLGHGRPKAFTPLGGRPLAAWSVRAFARHSSIGGLLVVTPPEWDPDLAGQMLDLVTDGLGEDVARVRGAVPGGARRQDSVRLGLEALRELLAPAGEGAFERLPVVVHDAARPIVPTQLIDDVLSRLREARDAAGRPRGVIPVVPVGDTLKEVAWPLGAGPRIGLGELAPGRRGLFGHVERTVPRAGLWLAQTPQGFTAGALLDAHREALASGFDATDDAMLYEWKGWCVEAVAGSPGNLKVTYPEDLALLAHALADRV